MKTTPDPDFVLIGGVAGQGTSLLGSLIDNHPAAICGPETSLFCHRALWSSRQALADLQLFLSNKKVPTGFLSWCYPDSASLDFYDAPLEEIIDHCRSGGTPESLVRLLYAQRLAAHPTCRVVADRSPENLYATDAFLKRSDAGKAIVVMMNGKSVVDSLISRGTDARLAVAAWVFDASIAYNLLEKYGRTGRIRLTRYEDLVSHPSAELAGICQFIGLESPIESLLESVQQGSTDTKGEEESDALKILYDVVADHRKLMEHVSPAKTLSSHQLHEYFGYPSQTNSSVRNGSRLPVLECGRALSNYEMFLLNKVRLLPPDGVFWIRSRVKTFELGAACVRKAVNGAVKAFRTLSAISRYVARGLGKGLEQVLASSSRQASPARRTIGFFYRLDQFLERRSPLITGKIIARRDSLRGALSVRAIDLHNRFLSNLGAHARVPLPEGKQFDAVCVIAFQDRNEIVTVVVDQILSARSSELTIGVILACSTEADINFAEQLRQQYGDIGIVMTENLPLGQKWQRAVDCAALAQPRYLFVTGSDDILTARFVEKHVRIMDEHQLGQIQLTGPRVWYAIAVHHGNGQAQPDVWRISYNSDYHQMPLGAGRIYSQNFLRSVNWQIFDTSLDQLLDDKGYNLVLNSNGLIYNPTLDDGFVLSAKGSWDAMNSLDKVLAAPSVFSERASAEEVESIRNELGETWFKLMALGQTTSESAALTDRRTEAKPTSRNSAQSSATLKP